MGLFSKETCALCGKEVGALKRTKIQNKEFICNDCDDGCSTFIDLYKLNKDEIVQHIEHMKKLEKLYNEVFVPSSKKSSYPSSPRDFGIIFADEVGMFQVMTSSSGGRHAKELFRYDQVAGYEGYTDTSSNSTNGKEEIKEAGVKITFLDPRGQQFASNNKGLRPHPFVEKEIKIVLASRPRERDYESAENMVSSVVRKFDYIFGVNDDSTALFSIRGSKNQQRKMQAGSDMLKGGIAMIKAAKAQKAGEEVDQEAVQAQLQQAADSASDAQTSGLARYSRAADEAEQRAWGE